MDNIHVARHLDLHVPFTVASFSDRVDSTTYFGRVYSTDGTPQTPVRIGDRIISVNGRPFAGLSVAMQEFAKLPGGLNAIHAVVQSPDGGQRQVDVTSPHCTCGVPALWEAIVVYAVTPMFCVLLGFAIVFGRPMSACSWGMLALMLSLSQLTLFPEPLTGFRLVSNVMVWTDWFRVPAVGYEAFALSIWPTALIAVMARSWRASLFSNSLIAVFSAWAVLRAVLAIAWSEDFQRLTWLHWILARHQTELIVFALLAVVVLGFAWQPRLGATWAVIASVAVLTLYRDVTPIAQGSWTSYSDSSLQFVGDVPNLHWTPRFVVLVAVVGMILAYLCMAPMRQRVRVIAGFALCLPLAIHVGGVYGNFWWALGLLPDHSRIWPLFVLISTACGLLTLVLWIRQQDSGDVASTAPLPGLFKPVEPAGG